jgi:uncharacterized protein involved in exopolysaccharide biosynthesis
MSLVPSKKFNLVQLLDIAFKRKLMILSVVMVTSIVSVLASLANPPNYESSAVLMVNVGREYIYRPEIGDPAYVNSHSYRLEEMVNSEIQILSSRDVKEQVIKTLGIANMYPDLLDKKNPLELAVAAFSESLDVKSIADSNIIRLYFDHQDPVVAAKALNLLIDVFNQKHLQVYENSQVPFLEGQLKAVETQMNSAEEALEKFKQQNAVYNIEKQTELLLGQRSDLERALNGVENQLKEIEQKDLALQAQMSQIPKNIPIYTEAKTDDTESATRLLQLQIEEQQLLSKYTENSRPVQNIRDEIKSIKNLIASQSGTTTGMVRTGKNPVLESLELESIRSKASLQSLTAKRDVIKQQIEDISGQLKNIDAKQNELRELNLKVDVAMKNRTALIEKLQEARSQSALDRTKSSSIRVVESAEVPIKAIGLSTKLRLLLAAFFGLVAGFGLALIAEFTQHRLSNAYAVEQRLQLPVLTVLPERE